ncbi:TIL-domain-containing protein [Backusella circina FSU 941]|nr:TIL-domain-containing protein [Backusella circina FSU 941]
MGAFRICPKICIPGCACADGYVKNSDGKCVRQEDCPYPYKPFLELDPLENPTCSPNEEYRMCKGCDQTCDNLGKPVICIYECTPGCACKDGYVRQDGKCIQQVQCPIPIPPNDFHLLPDATPYTPLDTGYPPTGTIPGSSEKCPINEVFSQCKACDQGCPDIDPPVRCTKDCRPGCSCKEGYVRSNGICISAFQCPQIDPMPFKPIHNLPEPQQMDNDCNDDAPSCPAHQHFTDCLPCNESCPGFGSDICPRICRSGCACDPGFSRTEDGSRCIPTIQCPQIDPFPEAPQVDDTCHVEEPPVEIPLDVPPKSVQPMCAANEEFTECGTCEPTCSSLKEPTVCLGVCIVGCQCKSGYVREGGKCIPDYQCSVRDHPAPFPVEYYPVGPPAIVDEPCQDDDELVPINPPTIVDEPCQDDDESVPINPPTTVVDYCPANEHFVECTPCNEKCPGFGSDICPFVCQSGCACDSGFSRMEGKCIRTTQCPQIKPEPSLKHTNTFAISAAPTPPLSFTRPGISAVEIDPPLVSFYPIPTQQAHECPANEVYSTCGGCEETCQSLYEPMMCAAVCIVGCQCKPGYVRENGKCVDASYCPMDPHTTTAEPTTWDIFTDTPARETDGACPINETFKQCKSCDQTCESLSDPLMCTMACVSGCSCIEGHVRNNGTCVPVSQCFSKPAVPVDPIQKEQELEEEEREEEQGPTKKCPVNEEFKSCKGCDQNCRTLHHPIMCSMICMPGCACKSGFVRKDGVCVEPSECPVETSDFDFSPFEGSSSVDDEVSSFPAIEPPSSILAIP